MLVAALSAVARELTAAGAAMCRRPALVVGRGGEARGAWRVSVGAARLVILYERRRGGNSSLPAFRCSVPNIPPTFVRMAKRSLLLGQESNNLDDGSAKSCGGRAKVDHTDLAIAPWMDGGDTCKGPLSGWSKLTPYEH